MEVTKNIKKLQCYISEETMAKIKKKAKEKRMNRGQFIDYAFKCDTIDSKNGLTPADDVSFTISKSLIDQNNMLKKIIKNQKPWWKKMFVRHGE